MEEITRIAVADDHSIVANGYSEIINAIPGFQVVIIASNGKELFDAISNAKILPEIVVMDISMPVWDGYEALDALKRKWPTIKVLILSMHKHEMAVIKM